MYNVIQLQHFKQLKDLSIKDLMVENAEEEDPNMAVNLLTVASTGNAAFLEELLRAGLDPDIGDSKGKTPLVCLLMSIIFMLLFIPFYIS
jgi:ankyrin repeat protein